ncbi:uncharacterized protein LOC122924243 [Bufo gargarizans]|uniref:uncharacterized protein LOC122924243 n=1 Tax=Bufo gargarizans TaxID=30331 RepID=UPI001CF42850|nr:uncharacterized protein LOC122924243 [Bufo gargarizans]
MIFWRYPTHKVQNWPRIGITPKISYKSLQKKLKHFIDLDKDLTNLTLSQIDSLIWWTQQALNSLKGYQSKVYDKTVRTTNCTMPLVPTNGGLVCAYLDNAYFCKPMCDQGYDFSFLRRSRLYEICGRQTGFSWTSQYVGGNRLAECTAADVAISGQSSAYFKNKKCQEALSMGIEDTYINEFIKELEENGDQHPEWEPPSESYAFLSEVICERF